GDSGAPGRPGGAGQGGRVGARAGLRKRMGGEPLPGREPREVALLLVVVARELEAERTELLDRQDETARGADLRDLLDRDEREERPGAEPAVLLLEQEPEYVVLAEELDDVPRKLVALVDLGRPRRDPIARELPDQVTELALFRGQGFVRHA